MRRFNTIEISAKNNKEAISRLTGIPVDLIEADYCLTAIVDGLHIIDWYWCSGKNLSNFSLFPLG